MNDTENMNAFTRATKATSHPPRERSGWGYGCSDGKRQGPSRRPRSEVQQSLEQIITEVAAEDLVELYFSRQEADEFLLHTRTYISVWREAMEKFCTELVKRHEAEKENKR